MRCTIIDASWGETKGVVKLRLNKDVVKLPEHGKRMVAKLGEKKFSFTFYGRYGFNPAMNILAVGMNVRDPMSLIGAKINMPK